MYWLSMIITLLYENKYFLEKIEIRKNMLKDLTVSLKGFDITHAYTNPTKV